MERLPEFIINNWVLFLTLAVVLLWMFMTESGKFSIGLPQLDASEATMKYNREDAQFVDVRGEADFRKAHLPGALQVSLTTIEQKNKRLERARSKPVIVYCQSGVQAGKVGKKLKSMGYEKVFLLKGGIASWQAANLPIDRD